MLKKFEAAKKLGIQVRTSTFYRVLSNETDFSGRFTSLRRLFSCASNWYLLYIVISTLSARFKVERETLGRREGQSYSKLCQYLASHSMKGIERLFLVNAAVYEGSHTQTSTS